MPRAAKRSQACLSPPTYFGTGLIPRSVSGRMPIQRAPPPKQIGRLLLNGAPVHSRARGIGLICGCGGLGRLRGRGKGGSEGEHPPRSRLITSPQTEAHRVGRWCCRAGCCALVPAPACHRVLTGLLAVRVRRECPCKSRDFAHCPLARRMMGSSIRAGALQKAVGWPAVDTQNSFLVARPRNTRRNLCGGRAWTPTTPPTGTASLRPRS